MYIDKILLMLLLISISFLLFEYGKDRFEEGQVKERLSYELSQFPEIKLHQDPWWDKSEFHVWSNISGKGTAIFWYTKEGKISGFLQLGDYFPHVNCKTNDREDYETFFYIGQNHNLKSLFPYEISTIRDLVNYYDQTVKVLATLPKDPSSGVEFASVFNGQPANCVLSVGKTSN